MAVRDDFTAGEVLAAADLNDTFASKLDLAGGKILQIVRATDATTRTTTSTSFVDASISVTITPQKDDSAVILIATFQGRVTSSTSGNQQSDYRITDNSDNVVSGGGNGRIGNADYSFSGTASHSSTVALIGYSTPATTSATTYKVRFRSVVSTTTTALVNQDMPSQLYAIEVSA
jgi:hypothetical protein